MRASPFSSQTSAFTENDRPPIPRDQMEAFRKVEVLLMRSQSPPEYSWGLVAFLAKQSFERLLGISLFSEESNTDLDLGNDTLAPLERERVIEGIAVRVFQDKSGDLSVATPMPDKPPRHRLKGSSKHHRKHAEVILSDTPEKKHRTRKKGSTVQVETLSQGPVGLVRGYDSRLVTKAEVEVIETIITTVAKTHLLTIAFKQKHLERLGDGIRNVHPLRFLGVIFSDPALFLCMHEIRDSGLKWHGFIGGGFIDRFSEEFIKVIPVDHVYNIDAAHVYVPGFAESLGIKPEDIQSFVDKEDIEGMVNFLLENPNIPGFIERLGLNRKDLDGFKDKGDVRGLVNFLIEKSQKLKG